jgi:hypothetical protein
MVKFGAKNAKRLIIWDGLSIIFNVHMSKSEMVAEYIIFAFSYLCISGISKMYTVIIIYLFFFCFHVDA